MVKDVNLGTINRYKPRANTMGSQWSSVLTFDVTFIKSFCHHAQEELIFTEDEVDCINTWLTSPDYPTLLHIYEADEDAYLDDPVTYSNELYLKYDYVGLFSEVQPVFMGGGIMGLKATFTTNSPFAWTGEKSVEATCLPAGTNVTINVNSSEKYREIYPLIEIVGVSHAGSTGSREEITITNNNDISTTYQYVEGTGYTAIETPRSLTLQVPHTAIYIDTEKSMIYDIVSIMTNNVNHLLTFDDLGLSDLSYIYWPRLFNGTNSWTITGSCTIRITWREPRKVGAY